MKTLSILFLILLAQRGYAGAAVTTASGAAAAAATFYLATATGSLQTGIQFMNKYCGNEFGGEAMCAAGAGLIVAAVANAVDSDKSHNAAVGLTPGSPGYSTPAQDAIAPQVAAANQIAAGQGTTLGSLASQAPTGAGSGAGGSGQAGVGGDLAGAATGADGQGADAAAAGNKSGYKVSSVGTDGGGGGGRAPASAGGADLGGLLAGINGSKAGASGLQKTLNGEPIGVASDNIFTKVTQAYQAKKTAQTFLPTGN